MSLSDRQRTSGRSALARVFAPIIDPWTYRNLAYLVFAFPLGVLYSMVLGFGFVFGVGLSVLFVGVGLLIALVFVGRGFTAFERRLAGWLFGIEAESTPRSTESEPLRTTVRTALESERTWRGFGFRTLKLWFGVVGVVLLAAFLRALSMLPAIVRLPHEIEFGELNGEPPVWTIETVPEAAVAGAIGLAVGAFASISRTVRARRKADGGLATLSDRRV